MRLELKHIAPYLPYKVNLLSTTTGKIHTLVYTDHQTNKANEFSVDMFIRHPHIKLLLKPLSDLTKEIEHNGERFVPITLLFELNVGCSLLSLKEYEIREPSPGYYLCHDLDSHFTMTLDTADDFNFRVFDRASSLTELKRQMRCFEKLFEWNFDVFGLIEKGLAIDINTLEL